MDSSANFLAISPELRERYRDWKACERARQERGYAWAPAAAAARLLYEEAKAAAPTPSPSIGRSEERPSFDGLSRRWPEGPDEGSFRPPMTGGSL